MHTRVLHEYAHGHARSLEYMVHAKDAEHYFDIGDLEPLSVKFSLKLLLSSLILLQRNGNIALLKNCLHLYLFSGDGLKNLNNNISFNFIT